MKKFSRCLPPLVAAIAAPGAQAVGLGELHAASQLGTPLRAWVELYAAPDDKPLDWRVEILPDYFAGQEAAPASVLEGLRGRVALSPEGRPYIAVESAAPIDYANLSFRLRLSREEEALTGRFSIRLPETAPPAPVVSKTPVRPRNTGGRRKSSVALPVAGPDTYGPVGPGESLWHIARKVAGGGNINTTMQQLFALNPEAFVRRDITRLRAGAVLKVPAGGAVSAPAGAARPPRDSVLSGETARSEAAPAMRDPALSARLKALDEKFAAIRARYGAPAAPVEASVALAPDAAPPALAGGVQDPPASVAPPAVPVEIAQGAAANLPPAPPAAAAPAATLVQPAPTSPPVAPPTEVTPAPVDTAAAPNTVARRLLEPTPAENAAAEPEEGLLGGGMTPFLLLGACTLAAAGVLAGRRLLAGRAAKKLGQHDPSKDETLKAEVARKTGNRVRLESEIRALVEPTGASSPRPESLSALPPLPLGAASGGDTEAIDINIAQGLYTEAETMLRAAIEQKPGNVQTKLRLAEVLYITDQPEAFSELAEDLMMDHRQDINDDDWQRLVRMGKMIAPDFALFSGPRPVGLRA